MAGLNLSADQSVRIVRAAVVVAPLGLWGYAPGVGIVVLALAVWCVCVIVAARVRSRSRNGVRRERAFLRVPSAPGTVGSPP